MAKKVFTDESLQTFVDETKAYTNTKISDIPTHNELTNEQIDAILGPLDGGSDDSGSGSGGGSVSTPNIELDGTLTQSGMAADAKVVGDRLAAKANLNHTHNISNITNLQTTLDNKANSTHTHNNATTSTSGFMSNLDKAKLNGIESGANKTVIDSSLSSTSTNPIQNKVVNDALESLNNSTVKTINGISPDSNGNVNIDSSGSESDDMIVTLSYSNGSYHTDTSAYDFCAAISNGGIVNFRYDLGNGAYIPIHLVDCYPTNGYAELELLSNHYGDGYYRVLLFVSGTDVERQEIVMRTATVSSNGLMSYQDKEKLLNIREEFVVEINYNTDTKSYYANHTYDEIRAAAVSGKKIVGYDNMILTLCPDTFDDTCNIEFRQFQIAYADDPISSVYYTITNNNTIYKDIVYGRTASIGNDGLMSSSDKEKLLSLPDSTEEMVEAVLAALPTWNGGNY